MPGTVTTDTWTDKDTGEKRTSQKILADIVGPSLRWATVRISRFSRVANDDTDYMPPRPADPHSPGRESTRSAIGPPSPYQPPGHSGSS